MRKHFLVIGIVSHILHVRCVMMHRASFVQVKQGLTPSVKCLEIPLSDGKMNSYDTKILFKFKILRKSVIWEDIQKF